MAIKTMSHSTGTGTWAEGWHELTIESAEYGDYNGSKFIDVLFEGYPKNFNLRIYEAINKETHEEFALARLFKMANAGIIDKIKSPNGKEAIQYDDDPKFLVGKKINTYFYKEGEYKRISNRIAPVVQDGDIISYTPNDVLFWKKVAEEYETKRKDKTPVAEDTTTTESSNADIPF